MKKIGFIATLLGALVGGFSSTAAFADCNPCCAPSCCELTFCGGKFKVGADWLYGKAQQDGLLIGEIETNVLTTTPTTADGHHIRPKFDYENGFRVYGGFELPCDQWELGAAYVYTPGKGSTGFHTPAINLPVGTTQTVEGFINTGETLLSGLSGSWKSNLNQVDLEFSRTIKCGECFKLRPHIGARAAWGNQKYHVASTLLVPITIDLVTEDFPLGTTTQYDHYKQKFQGYGVEGGLWAEYNLSCGLSVVGHVGGSVLYSKFNTHHRIEEATVTPTTTTLLSVDTDHDTIWTAIPTVEYFAGLQYADNMCDYDFSIHVGYAQQVFFDLNRMTRQDGNYSFQGLVLGADVAF